jgi:hypothetical protein
MITVCVVSLTAFTEPLFHLKRGSRMMSSKRLNVLRHWKWAIMGLILMGTGGCEAGPILDTIYTAFEIVSIWV